MVVRIGRRFGRVSGFYVEGCAFQADGRVAPRDAFDTQQQTAGGRSRMAHTQLLAVGDEARAALKAFRVVRVGLHANRTVVAMSANDVTDDNQVVRLGRERQWKHWGHDRRGQIISRLARVSSLTAATRSRTRIAWATRP